MEAVIATAAQCSLNTSVQVQFSRAGYPVAMKTLCFILFLTLATANPVVAQAAPGLIGAERAVAVAQARYFGELLDVAITRSRQAEPVGAVYEIKLLTDDGQVLRLRIKADDGTFLEATGNDLARALRPTTGGIGARP